LESGGKSRPKASFSIRIPNGDFLHLAVWAGKSDPTAEVLAVDIRHYSGEQWSSIARLAVYRTKDGNYSQLPDRSQTTAKTSSDKAEPP
jgi:hypothetical protein